MKVNDISYYLFESYKDAQAKFAQEASEEEVKQYLETFKQLAKKGTVSGQEKDIGYWIKQGWNKFKEFVDSKFQEKSKSEDKKSKKKESIIAYDDDEKLIVIPLSKDASCYYGKNTQWCTSATESRNHFNEYFYGKQNVLFYVFSKETGKKYAIAYPTLESGEDIIFFDENDEEIDGGTLDDELDIGENTIDRLYNQYEIVIDKAMDLNNASEDIQLEIIQDEPERMESITQPNENIQLEFVRYDCENIKYIHNPTEKVQLEAINEDGLYIKYIHNPSEKIQLEAVREDGNSIRYIDNPSEKVQLEAVKENGNTLRNIDNPSVKVQLEAIKETDYALKDLENPSEEVQIEAVRNSKLAINYINNPSEKAKELHRKLWES